MIHVRVVRKDHLIQSITVTGHADSDVYGHDLVCAIVSGIMTGLCNAMDQLAHEDNMIVDEGHVEIHVTHPNETTHLLLVPALIQLQTAADVNQDH